MSLRQWGQIVKRGWQDPPETEKELGKEMAVTVYRALKCLTHSALKSGAVEAGELCSLCPSGQGMASQGRVPPPRNQWLGGSTCLLVCLAFLHRVDPRKATPGFQTHEVRAGELCISGCVQINYAPVVQNC